MKKLIIQRKLTALLLALVLVVPCLAAAQSVTTYRDSFGWNAVTNTPVWTLVGYDVVFSQTNVVATQLGSSNTIPVVTGVIASSRVTTTVIPWTTLLSADQIAGSYTLWLRSAMTPVGGTNIVVSPWGSISVTWASLPPTPTGLHIIPAP